MPKPSTFPSRLASQIIDSDYFPMGTNAGENVKLPVSEARQLLGLAGSATVNAYNEVGATNEIKIQAAISRAVSTGRTIVFIPTSFLPYNAALVTFDTAIQMVREGGSYDVYDLKAYGATGDGTVDDTAAIVAAVAGAALEGNIVFIPTGIFKTTSTIYIPRWVQIEGVGYKAPGNTYDGVSVILGAHTGAAILSFKDSLGCRLENFLLQGDITTSPKTGLCFGRNLGLGSAGSHAVTNVNITGYFSECGVYMVASEENVFFNLQIYIQGGGALYGLWLSQGDNLAVDSLGASSNLHNSFYDVRINSDVDDDGWACIAIYGGTSTGDIRFFGGYLIPNTGRYVFINVGNQDGSSMSRHIYFYATSGEEGAIHAGPLYGYDLDGQPTLAMQVIVEGSYFPCRVGGFFLKVNPDLTLRDSRVFVPTQNRGSSYVVTQLQNCDIDLGFPNGALGSNRQIFSDMAVMSTNKFGISADASSGLYFGDPADAGSVKIRYGSGVGDIQALNHAGTVFIPISALKFLLEGWYEIRAGTGSPESVVTAPAGSLYLNGSGGAATTLYIKESGSGNTGWVAK